MENESVKSEQSGRSRRLRSNSSNGITSKNSDNHGNALRQLSHRNYLKTGKDGCDVGSPQGITNHMTTEETREGQEVIEVQILPQDNNWGENMTALTGNTSDQSISIEGINNIWQRESDLASKLTYRGFCGSAFSLLLGLGAFFSPVAMVVMPRLGFFPSVFDHAELTQTVRTQLLACSSECKGLLVSLSARLVLLSIGLWALFLRRSIAIMPRIYLFRSVVVVLVAVSTFAYWLFYIVQVTNGARVVVETGGESVDYKSLVAYATNFVDTLLFIHYIAVVLLELRHQQPKYYVKVIRSPDGVSHSYMMGQLTIQRAALWVLQHYYVDFPIFNPFLERIPITKSQRKISSSFKYYDVDGVCTSQQHSQSRAMLAASARRRDSSHNERFYDEYEYERRVKKRRARLITAAEEAFTHIKRIHNESGPALPLDSIEAAQAVFPSMARALQKYLRVTRQQPRHTFDSIHQHLAHCLKHDLSPRAFLEPYLVEEPVLQSAKERGWVQSWALICDEVVLRPVTNKCTFQLMQTDVSLMVSVYKLPYFRISEKVVEPDSNKFVLKLNSETSV